MTIFMIGAEVYRMKPVGSDEQESLECPFCEGVYHHVLRVGTELDPDEDEISLYEGTNLIFDRHSSERRSAVRIDFRGECGHYWSLILQQHKGMMTLYSRALDNPPVSPEDWEAMHAKTLKKL